MTLRIKEEFQILYPCRRPGEMGPKVLRNITAEPLQLRDRQVKGTRGAPWTLGHTHCSISQAPGWRRNSPLWVGTDHRGFPENPCPHPIACCARLEEHLEHHCHPENYSPTAFGMQYIKVRVLGCPVSGFISVLGFFWPSCSSRTHHTHDLSP